MSDVNLNDAIGLINTIEDNLPRWRAWFPNELSGVEVTRRDLLALAACAKAYLVKAGHFPEASDEIQLKACGQITSLDLELYGFRQSASNPSLAWCRRFETDTFGTGCELRLLADDDGWIVEVWNWQGDEPANVEQRVALPRLLTELVDLVDLVRIFSKGEQA